MTLQGEEVSLVLATKKGLVKKTRLSEYNNINRNGIIAISLREDDEAISCSLSDPQSQILLVTRKGMGIRFPESDVRSTGRNTMGVRGIALGPDDEVIAMIVTDNDDQVAFITEHGLGKRSLLSEFRCQKRGGKGLIAYRINKRTGLLVRACLAPDEKDILLINDLGVVIRVHAGEIPLLSRATQGVTLMRSKEGLVTDVAVVDHEDESEEDQTEPEQNNESAEADPSHP